MRRFLTNHQHKRLVAILVHPINRHVRHGVSVIPFDRFTFFAIEIEFVVKILALSFVRNKVIESRPW